MLSSQLAAATGEWRFRALLIANDFLTEELERTRTSLSVELARKWTELVTALFAQREDASPRPSWRIRRSYCCLAGFSH